MGTLTLNDGTVLQNSYGIISSGVLFVYVGHNGSTIASVLNLFDDDEKTERIVYTQANGENIVFLDYIKLIAVRDEGDGLFTAVLKRGNE